MSTSPEPAGYDLVVRSRRAVLPHGTRAAAVAVRGPVASLLLFTYGRLAPADPRLAVFGEADLLTAWQQKTAL